MTNLSYLGFLRRRRSFPRCSPLLLVWLLIWSVRRFLLIHLAPLGSLFISKLAAKIESISFEFVGFIIALDIPDAIAIGRKLAFIACRFGNPKDMFEAPHVVLTLSSSLKRRTSLKTCLPAVAIAPMGITKGSTTISEEGMPKSAALWTIFFATSKRTFGSSDIPVSSLEIATTGTLNFFTRGSICVFSK